jgi:hypothetical protein
MYAVLQYVSADCKSWDDVKQSLIHIQRIEHSARNFARLRIFRILP